MQIKHNFITTAEQQEIAHYIRSYRPAVVEVGNERVRYLTEETKGFSAVYDFTKTELSEKIAAIQSDNRVLEEVPSIFHELKQRIAEALNIKTTDVFVQGILVGQGGRIAPHYDAAPPGYVTYKCNIVISGPKNDIIYVDKEKITLNDLDLYAFEANFYKHSMDAAEERIVLSYGFILSYSDLEWDATSPRVKLSNRIWQQNTC
jgi:hypothetical protein